MNSRVPGEDALISLWRKSYEHWLRLLDFFPSFLTTIGAAFFAAASLMSDQTRWVTFGLACVIALIGVLFSYRNGIGARRIKRDWDLSVNRLRERAAAQERDFTRCLGELQRQIDALVAPEAEIASFLLERVLADLGFSDADSRASIFTRDDEGNVILVARFSLSAHIRQPGKASYQLSEGAVARGWDRPYLDVVLPKRRNHWEHAMRKKYGVPSSLTAQLRMQARSLAAVPLLHTRGATAVTVGVLMIEHREPDRISGESVDRLLDMPNMKPLGSLCLARNRHAELCVTAPRVGGATVSGE